MIHFSQIADGFCYGIGGSCGYYLVKILLGLLKLA